MNTVPSGVSDFCMYGASLVGGTVTTGWLLVEEDEELLEDSVDVDLESVVVVADESRVRDFVVVVLSPVVVASSVVDVASVVFASSADVVAESRSAEVRWASDN